MRSVDFKWTDNIALMTKDAVIGMVADYFEAALDGCVEPTPYTGGHPLGNGRHDVLQMESCFVGWLEHFDNVDIARIVYKPLRLGVKRITDFERISLLETAAITLQNPRSPTYLPGIVQNNTGKYNIPTRRISVTVAGCVWEAEIQIVVAKEKNGTTTPTPVG